MHSRVEEVTVVIVKCVFFPPKLTWPTRPLPSTVVIGKSSLLTLKVLFYLSKKTWNVPYVPTHIIKINTRKLVSQHPCCGFLHGFIFTSV